MGNVRVISVGIAMQTGQNTVDITTLMCTRENKMIEKEDGMCDSDVWLRLDTLIGKRSGSNGLSARSA